MSSLASVKRFIEPDPRRLKVYGILDAIAAEIEPTKEHQNRAESAYIAVGKWLAASDNPLLRGLEVYAHGSAGIGTAIRPVGRDEFDIDLIGFAPNFDAHEAPEKLKAAVGQRLAEHSSYAKILEEKKRCWRLNYVGDFHLDFSPTIRNPICTLGGELVPDRKLRAWHPTNPRGYSRLFSTRAALTARYSAPFLRSISAQKSSLQPFPSMLSQRGVLPRGVQLLKRHRDNYFLTETAEIAPISIVITTLAMRAYEYCVRRHEFEDELQLLIDVIRLMPHFIDRPIRHGRQIYAVWNETTDGENFAERWNEEPARRHAFFEWHAQALKDLETLRDAVGIDEIAKHAQLAFGTNVAKRVIGKFTNVISDARSQNRLSITKASGLVIGESAFSTKVPKNDFFGD